jgi:hypothetical protein
MRFRRALAQGADDLSADCVTTIAEANSTRLPPRPRVAIAILR